MLRKFNDFSVEITHLLEKINLVANVVMNENDQIFSAEDRKKIGTSKCAETFKMGSKR